MEKTNQSGENPKKSPKVKERQKRSPKVDEQRDWLTLLFKYRYTVIFLLAFSLYANTIFNDYNLDDELVTRNHPVTSQGIGLENIEKIFSKPYYEDNMGYSYGYRPLTMLSFTIEHSIFGDNPHASHFINLILYCLLCIVLLKALELIFIKYEKWLPLVIISLFTCHPVHTEVVASIKNRDEIMSFLCGGLVFWSLFRPEQNFWKRFIPGLLFFIAGMLFKPNLVILPAVIVIALLYFRPEKARNVFIVSLLFSLISVYFIENVSDGFKLLYIISGLVFCIGMIGIFNRWNPLGFFKRNFHTTDWVIEASEQMRFPIHLKPNAYFIFIGINMLIGLGAYYLSLIYVNPWIIIGVEAIYVVEFYFFQLDQLLPVLLFFDLLELFLVTGHYSTMSVQLLRNNIKTFFILTHLFITINIKGKKFWPIFIAFFVVVSIGLYYASQISAIVSAIIVFPLMVLMYRTDQYKSKMYTISIFVLAFLCGYNAYNLLFYPRFNFHPKFFEEFFSAVLLLILFCISFWKISQTKMPGIFAFSQVVIIVFFFSLSTELNTTTDANIKTVKSNLTQLSQKIIESKPVKLFPSAYSSRKLDRPITFIEVPVEYNSSLNISIGTSAYQFGRYFLLLLKPWPLSFYYGYKVMSAHSINEPMVILSILIFAGLLLLGVFLAKNNKVMSFGIFFILMSILPYLYVSIAIPGLLADRYTFQASLGFSILVACCFVYFYDLPHESFLASYIDRKKVGQAVKLLFMVLMLGYASMTVARNNEWKDSITLMRHDVKIAPESIQAHNLLGINLVKASFNTNDPMEQKQLREEALVHIKKARELFPSYFNFTYDIGRIFSLLNMPDSALFYYKEAYPLNPDYPDISIAITEILFAKNDFQASIPYLVKLIQVNPGDYTVYDKLSLAYFKTNQPELSIRTNEEAIKRAPSRPEPYVNIGICYFTQNNRDSARAWFNRALVVSPDHPMAVNYLKQLK